MRGGTGRQHPSRPSRANDIHHRASWKMGLFRDKIKNPQIWPPTRAVHKKPHRSYRQRKTHQRPLNRL
nr:MAG TPA: hypothetical protein [Caudoviricetes sp.]